MHICAFCAYINGLSISKPNVECYIYDLRSEIPHELKYMETSGAHVTHDYKIIPRNDSCFFDKTEILIKDKETQDNLSFWQNKIICDSCLGQLLANGKVIVTSELSENEKLFRMYLRGVGLTTKK